MVYIRRKVIEGPPCPCCGRTAYRQLYSTRPSGLGSLYDIAKCESCELVRTLPPPTPSDLQELYDEAYYSSRISDTRAQEEELARFWTLYGLVKDRIPRGRLLSVGCGLGFDVRVAKQLGFAAEGIELSPAAVKFAQSTLGVEVRLCDFAALASESESYDVVTFWDALEHLVDPRASLDRARRLIRARGCVLVRAPNVEGLFPRVSLCTAKITGEWRHPSPPHHVFDFSPKTLARLASAARLKVRSTIVDEWPQDRLIEGSRRPLVTKFLSAVLYPRARRTATGNSFIMVLERDEGSQRE